MKHIIWDWNGTLLDDSRLRVESVVSAFNRTGIAAVGKDDFRHHFTRPIRLFFERMTGRPLTKEEHAALRTNIDASYDRGAPHLGLTKGASATLRRCVEAGNSQSLLSMCPDAKLHGQVDRYGIREYFSCISGYPGTGPDTKARHLARHLERIDRESGGECVLVGDTVDDALAAESVKIRCILYHSERDGLESLTNLSRHNCPVVDSLESALDLALGDARQYREAASDRTKVSPG